MNMYMWGSRRGLMTERYVLQMEGVDKAEMRVQKFLENSNVMVLVRYLWVGGDELGKLSGVFCVIIHDVFWGV